MPNVSCMYMICCMYHFNRGQPGALAPEKWHEMVTGHCDKPFCIWNLALKIQFSTIVRSLSYPTFYHAWTPFPPPENRLSIFWFKILSSSRISSFRANMTRLHLTRNTWTGKTRSNIHHLQHSSNCSQMCFQSCQSAGQIISVISWWTNRIATLPDTLGKMDHMEPHDVIFRPSTDPAQQFNPDFPTKSVTSGVTSFQLVPIGVDRNWDIFGKCECYSRNMLEHKFRAKDAKSSYTLTKFVYKKMHWCIQYKRKQNII